MEEKNKTTAKYNDIDYQFILDSDKFPELKKEFDDFDKLRNIYKFFHSTLNRFTKEAKKTCLEQLNGEIGKTQEFGIFNYKIDFRTSYSVFKAKNLLSRLNINRGLIEKEIKIESLGGPYLDGRIGYIRSHQMANIEKNSNDKFKNLVDFISSAPQSESTSVLWGIDKKLSSMVEEKKDKIKNDIKQLIEKGDLPSDEGFVKYQVMFDNNISYEETSRSFFSVPKLIKEISNICDFSKDKIEFISEDKLSEDKYDIIKSIKIDEIKNINSPTQIKKILEENGIDHKNSKDFKNLIKENSIVYIVKYTDKFSSTLDNNKKGLISNINEFKKSDSLLNSIVDLSKDNIINDVSDKDREFIEITLRNLSSSRNEEESHFDKEYMSPNFSKETFLSRIDSDEIKKYIDDTYSKYMKMIEDKTPIEFCNDYVSRDIISEVLTPVNSRSKNDHRAILKVNIENNSIDYINNIWENYPSKGISESDYIEKSIFKEMVGEDDDISVFSDKNNEFDIDTFLSLHENDNDLSDIETKDYVDLEEFELNGGNFIGYIKYLKLNCFSPEQVSYSNKMFNDFITEKSLKEDIKKINKMEDSLGM